MTLQQPHRKSTQPTQIIPHHTLPRPVIVLSKCHIQYPMHGLDSPMASDCLRESLSAQTSRRYIVAYHRRLAAVVVRDVAYAIPDRFHARPVLRRPEILRHIRREIRPVVCAAVARFATLEMAILQVLDVAIQMLLEMRSDRLEQVRLIVFYRNHRIAAPFDDPFHDRLLAAHRVDRNDRAFQRNLLQKQGDRGDLVRFFVRRNLPQSQTFLAGPRTHQVQRAEESRVVVRAATRLTIDCNQTLPGLRGFVGSGGGDLNRPRRETTLEGFGPDGEQNAPDAIS